MSKVGKKIEAGLTPAQERALAGFDSLPNAAHVDVHVVAAVKGISVPSVWRWARNGLIPQPVRVTPGTTRWNVGQLRGIK